MKVLLITIGLIVFCVCVDSEEVEQQEQQVKTEQIEEVKEEVKEEKEEVKEEVPTYEERMEQIEEQYKSEYEVLFKNSPYPFIDFEYKSGKHLVTLQADITRGEWVQGFYSQLDSRNSYCGQMAHSVGRPSNKKIAEWVNQCNQVVATGKFDNLEWYYTYHNMNGYTEQAELDEVFNPLQCLYTLTGDKENLEITVVDVNGDLIYKVANEDVQTVHNSVKEWASDEQLWILSHSRDFAKGYYWFGYYEGWLGLE